MQAQVKNDRTLLAYLDGTMSVEDYADHLVATYKNKRVNSGNNITWCTATANFCSGCNAMTAGCGGTITVLGATWHMKCWAEDINDSMSTKNRYSPRKGTAFSDKLLHPDRLPALCRGAKNESEREVIFTPSMSDLFHNDFPERFIELVFHFLEKCDWHIYIIVTKRPEPMAKYIKKHYTNQRKELPKHIILGVSLTGGDGKNARVDRQYCDILRKIPCETRMVSLEPMIGPLDPSVSFKDLQWIVVGGCSGKDAPPMDPLWAQNALNRAKADGAVPHFKQNGEWAQQSDVVGRPIKNLPVIKANSSPDGPSVDLYRYGVTPAGRVLNGQYYDGFPSVITSDATLDQKIRGQLNPVPKGKSKKAKTNLLATALTTPAFQSLALEDISKDKLDALEFLWEPYFVRGDITIISGPEGEGKTHVMIDVLARMITGRAMPMATQPVKPERVLYFSSEARTTLKKRFLAAGVDDKAQRKFIRANGETLSWKGDLQRIEEAIIDWKPGVVVFDPLAVYARGTSSTAVRDEIEPLRKIARDRHMGVIIIAHPPKDRTSSISGNGQYRALTRSSLFNAVIPGSGGAQYAIVHDKANETAPGPSLKYEIRTETVGTDKNGQDVKAGRIEWLAEDASLTVATVLRKTTGSATGRSTRERCKDDCYALLKEPSSRKNIDGKCEARGFADRTIRRALEELTADGMIERYDRPISFGKESWFRRKEADVDEGIAIEGVEGSNGNSDRDLHDGGACLQTAA